MLAPLDGRHVYSTNESTPQIKLIKQASSPINTQAMETNEASEVLRSPLALKILTLKISALTPFVILSTYCKFPKKFVIKISLLIKQKFYSVYAFKIQSPANLVFRF